MKFEFGKRAVTVTPELMEHYLAWHKHYAPKCGGGTKLSNHCRHWSPFVAGYAASAELGVAKVDYSDVFPTGDSIKQ